MKKLISKEDRRVTRMNREPSFDYSFKVGEEVEVADEHVPFLLALGSFEEVDGVLKPKKEAKQ